MSVSKRIGCLILLVVCCATLIAAPASASGDWRALYQSALKSSAGFKRAVALCDITGDGLPELAVLSIDSAGTTSLKVYTATASGVSALTMDEPLTLSGVKKVSMQLRKGAGGEPVLDAVLKGASQAKRVALKYSGGGLKTAFSVAKASANGKTRYTVNGSASSQSQCKAALDAHAAANKKIMQLPLSMMAKGDGASAIQSKFAALVKKHAAYGQVNSLALNKSSATLSAGEGMTLAAKCAPATAFTDAVQWISDNEYIATVDGRGNVKAVAAGKVKIYARTASGTQKYCALTVTGPKPTKIKLNESALTLIKGGSATLTSAFEPAGASAALSWSSSNPKVASVDQKGAIVATGDGKATITVTTDNKLKATCAVVVTSRPAVVVDISQHEYSSKMDWAKVAKSVDLMILRCGVTRTATEPIGIGKDAKFAYYAEQCKKYGIPFGVYYYGKCSDTATAKKEAKMTWDIASPYNPLFYVYDVEEARLTKAVIEAYTKELKSLGAKKVGYYIAHHLYASYKLDTSMVDFIWLPHYGKNTGAVNSTPSYPCDMHQYTSVGKIDGLVGGVDVSRLMGSKTLAWYLKR